MNKSETNGYLRALESQLSALVTALNELNRTGDFAPEAFESFRVARIDLINAAHATAHSRGFNGTT